MPRKIFQQAGADSLHHLSHGLGIVEGGHADEDVHLSDVHQFTKKIIRENASFGQTNPPLFFRSFAGGTSRTGKGPGSADTAGHLCGEKYSCQTFQSGCCPCGGADQVPPPGRSSTNYSPPESCPSPVVVCTPGPCDSQDTGTRSCLCRIRELTCESL